MSFDGYLHQRMSRDVAAFECRDYDFKVAYFGAAGAGKTTNVHWLHGRLGHGALRSATVGAGERVGHVLWFDCAVPALGGARVRVATVPGACFWESPRDAVMHEADCVVFVADSAPGRLDATVESAENLLDRVDHRAPLPVVLQFNKRDAARALPIQRLRDAIPLPALAEHLAAVAAGQGVLETFGSAISALAVSGTSRPSATKLGP